MIHKGTGADCVIISAYESLQRVDHGYDRRSERGSGLVRGKFALRNEGRVEDDGTSSYCQLVSRQWEFKIVLAAKEDGGSNPEKPIIDTGNAAKAREWLLARV